MSQTTTIEATSDDREQKWPLMETSPQSELESRNFFSVRNPTAATSNNTAM